ncbi:MAG: sugar isomerase [Bacteroidetes bacterium]|nr:MAG: sugar isomerase [Bacteroidota bacterium]
MKIETLDVYREVAQQPGLWKKVYADVLAGKDRISSFLNVYMKHDSEVVFTGAGSSFFVGEMVAGYFQEKTGRTTKAVSTTEIVTYPTHYISKNKPVLLVSFARSGNSPESVAAVKMAEETNPNIAHLIITCNKDGELARCESLENKFVYLLPEEANDKALAMTSSVTSMALVVLLLANLNNLISQEKQIEAAASLVEMVLEKYGNMLAEIASRDFERAVFLGSGPFYGLAHEAHLKVQEMTDGQLICKFDSFLGFRHGPKVVVNDKTLMVYLHSPKAQVRRYEDDLVRSINKEQNPAFKLGICDTCDSDDDYDAVVTFSEKKYGIDEAYFMLAYLVPVQLFSIFKSIEYGLNPDAPSASGAIHRVVQGVKIYND